MSRATPSAMYWFEGDAFGEKDVGNIVGSDQRVEFVLEVRSERHVVDDEVDVELLVDRLLDEVGIPFGKQGVRRGNDIPVQLEFRRGRGG
ncbi:hypothetical protein [Cohnella rhizosphaerae]|uniref:Uncharacterized protein n=1 Tax=Cohnella rhizosphaerae TaxID=1457232 RepID=A0A9X4QVE9_9BACL|nr:hypothetical protein [Cohnella rhizosphaerae]MDG0812665.1 hypothetical protein [Cohnella rhizosphaerae]